MSAGSSPSRACAGSPPTTPGASSLAPGSSPSMPEPPPPPRNFTREAPALPQANPRPAVTLKRAPRRVSGPAVTATRSHRSLPRGRKEGGRTSSTARGRNGRTTADGGGRGTPTHADGSDASDALPAFPRPFPAESTSTRVTLPHIAETLDAVITPATIGRNEKTTSVSPGTSSTGPSILAEQVGLGKALCVRDPPPLPDDDNADDEGWDDGPIECRVGLRLPPRPPPPPPPPTLLRGGLLPGLLENLLLGTLTTGGGSSLTSCADVDAVDDDPSDILGLTL